MADILVNLYSEAKKYQKLLMQKGRDVPSDEMNELQDIIRVAKRRTERELWGDGFFNFGFKIVASTNPNEIIISSGSALLQGEYYKNDSDFPISSLITPGSDRQDVVYLRAREVEITSIDDPDILFTAIGETARRVKLQVDVLVSEGSTTVPTTTGDLHDAGIHYQLIGILNRQSGNATIDSTQIEDDRRLIGIFFVNEDKNLQVVGGGNIGWETLGAGKVSFDDDLRIIQPSTGGHAIVQAASYPSGFDLSTDGSVAYVSLNRSASTDYNVSLQLGNFHTIPNSSSAFPLFYNIGGLLYAVDGTTWGSTQTHKLRQNPITGQIYDADVATLANINGSKLADNSVPNSKLIGPLPDSLTSGNICMREDGPTCPSGYSKVSYGSADDLFIQIAASGSAGNTTPTGVNTHNHGAHHHGPGTYGVPLALLDISQHYSFQGGGIGFNYDFDAFQAGVGSGFRIQTFAVTGNSADTTPTTVDHRPRHITLILCKKI